VVRGPVFWFFLTTSLYFFLGQIGSDKYRWALILSSLSFLIATWARTEGVLFIAVSCFYLLVFERHKRVGKLTFFLIPVALLILLGLFGMQFLNTSLDRVFRLEEILAKLSGPFVSHNAVRERLSVLATQPVIGTYELFFRRARRLVWFIALGALLSHAVTAFFYPYFLLFLTGLGGMFRRLRADRKLLYLVLLSIAALVLLYFHVLQTWVIGNRFLGLFIIPAFVFVGFGLKRLLRFLETRFKLKSTTAFAIACLLIVVVALPKNLGPREEDKFVFREIAEFITAQEASSHVIKVAASEHLIRWISFYTNDHYPGAPCPHPDYETDQFAGNTYREFVKNMKGAGIEYFVWEEKHWPHRFDFLRRLNPENVVNLGTWSHPDTGKIILFKIL
jgi:hypothetical protein